MINSLEQKQKLTSDGFAIVDDIYSNEEVIAIIETINNADISKNTFRKSSELFAIRQFLNEVPNSVSLIFNAKLKALIQNIVGVDFFVVKSIYFDKPPQSNWYVSYHQDLTISVKEKHDIDGYKLWTSKQNQFAVQPPIKVLENIVTFRIHLDDTDENNGALKIISQSHNKNIYRPETIDWTIEQETTASVPQGGVMVMKPLILHSSGRTNNNKHRRVIHIEISNIDLPSPLNWAEKIIIT